MKLSTRGRYGTRLMLQLAANYGKEDPLPLTEIAKREGISVKYLEQLIIPLKAAGLIESRRGAHGGYVLAKAPDEITIGQILQILEGNISPVPCVKNPSFCIKYETCSTRKLWETMDKAIEESVCDITLKDALSV